MREPQLRVPIPSFEFSVKEMWLFRVPSGRGYKSVAAKDMTPDLWEKHIAFEEREAKQEAEAKCQQVREKATKTQDLLAAFALGLTGDEMMSYRRPQEPRIINAVVERIEQPERIVKSTVKRSDA